MFSVASYTPSLRYQGTLRTMNRFITLKAAAASSRGGGYMSLLGAAAYDDGGAAESPVVHTSVVRGGTHTYIRWTTEDVSADITYDAAHGGTEIHTTAGNGVITIPTAGNYMLNMTVGVTMSTTVSQTAFAQIAITQSDGSTAISTVVAPAFLRTNGNGSAGLNASFGFIATAGALVKVFLYKSSVGSGFTLDSASSSLLITELGQ